jgi:hypothetical protein
LYGQGFFLGLGVLSGFVFNAVHRGTLPLASVGRPNPFFKVGIVSLQIGLQISGFVFQRRSPGDTTLSERGYTDSVLQGWHRILQLAYNWHIWTTTIGLQLDYKLVNIPEYTLFSSYCLRLDFCFSEEEEEEEEIY